AADLRVALADLVRPGAALADRPSCGWARPRGRVPSPGQARAWRRRTPGRPNARLQAAAPSAPLLLRRLVQGEIVLVVAALFAAAVLSSLAPPSSALAKIQDTAARRGPGPVATTVSKSPYKVQVRVTPNRAAVSNAFSLTLTRNGKPVPGAG